MTVFLRDGTVPGDVEQLRMALEGLPEVTSVAALSAEEARTRFLRDTDLGADLSSLPADAFPASLELALAAGTSAARVEAISTRLRRFRAVDDVESYRGWFERLERLLAAEPARFRRLGERDIEVRFTPDEGAHPFRVLEWVLQRLAERPDGEPDPRLRRR